MGVKVTFEFDGVDQAIVALGKLAGVPVKAANRAATGTAPVAPAPVTDKPSRKPRSDRGQARGPHANAAGASAASVPGVVTVGGAAAPTGGAGNSTSGTTDQSKAGQQAATSTSTTPPAPAGTINGTPPVPATTAPAAPATQEDAQKVLERLFNEKGMPTAQDVLSRFGVKRLRDMLPASYGDFVELANKVLAGGSA